MGRADASATTDYRRDNSLYCSTKSAPSFVHIGNDLHDCALDLYSLSA